MNRIRSSLALSLPLAVALGWGASQRGGVDLTGAIAVIDLDAAHGAFPLEKQKLAELQAKREELNRGLKELEQIAEEKELAIQSLEPGTTEYHVAVEGFRNAKYHYESRREGAKDRLGASRARMSEEVTRALHKEVDRFAKQKGYQLVFRAWHTGRARSEAEADAVLDLVYHDPKLDVTQQLVAFLQAANPAPAASNR